MHFNCITTNARSYYYSMYRYYPVTMMIYLQVKCAIRIAQPIEYVNSFSYSFNVFKSSKPSHIPLEKMNMYKKKGSYPSDCEKNMLPTKTPNSNLE